MALEYVDLKYGRIYFVRGTHQLHYLPGIKKLAARSYLGIKRALEEAMRNSDALAEECVYFLGDIRKYPRGLKNLRFQVDESNLNPGDDTDYTILKCIKEGKDLYWCDVFQGAGAIRKLADIFLPGALMLELGAIIQLSAPQYMWPYLVFLATYAGYSLKTLVKPDFRTSRALRRLGRLLLPLRGIIYKFREITTAIQLKILLFEIYKKRGGWQQ